MTRRTIFRLKHLTHRSRAKNRASRACIIALFASQDREIMEAEQINSISNKLEDIAQRAAELRRYL